MAQSNQPPQDFIKNAFKPEVAVLCSPLVEQICQKNNLSFVELCQPFCKLNNDVHFKDPNGTPITICNLKLSLSYVHSVPPQAYEARKYLNSSVSDAQEARQVLRSVADFQLNVPYSTPWFEAWRDTFLQVQYPSDHEFTKHFLACILVVSSADIDPVTGMVKLVETLNQIQIAPNNKLPKWFNSNILRYYVIVHDNYEGNEEIARSSLEAMQISYGVSNCFLLRMNSRPPGSSDEQLPDPWSQFITNRIESSEKRFTPEPSPPSARSAVLEVGQEASESGNTLSYHPLSPNIEENPLNDILTEKEKMDKDSLVHVLHGGCLSTHDVEEVKVFMREFCAKALLPYVEKQIQLISDVVANKKGVGRTFFFTTKKWFSSNKPGPTGAFTNPLYAPDSHELQMRRLGDLYFMFGHYTMAYQAYHSVKRDFDADQAWLYYAGALEMASLAAFMANTTTKKTWDYMEESIVTYLNTCKMPQFATRATLLSSECLKGRQLYGEAAHQLIRMTSEDSDLRSALLLEQAAYCFLNSNMVRKYAFHMVLAGHRFSKAAQRKHSLRSYKQAHQVYQKKGWNLAEDHINYTIGRQANNLQLLEEAVDSFSKLLADKSKQPAHQQTVFLKEYITIYNLMMKNGNNSLRILPLPLIENDKFKILTGPTPPLSTPGQVPASGILVSKSDDSLTAYKWIKLEEMVVQEAQGSLPITFKPLVSLYTPSNLSTINPTSIVHEPIQVSLKFSNPLQIVFNLKNIYLLWKFEDASTYITNEDDSNSVDKYIKTTIIKSIVLQPKGQQEIILSVTPLHIGKLTLTGVCLDIVSSSLLEDTVAIKGKKPFDVNGKKEVVISILSSAPCLQVLFSEICTELLCNEIQKVSVSLKNVGTLPLRKIYLATSVPDLISFDDFEDKSRYNVQGLENASAREKLARKNHVTQVPLPNDRLEPNQSHSINIWIMAPERKGSVSIDILFYYENIQTTFPKYRLIRHVWQLQIQESIQMELQTQQSFNSTREQEMNVCLKVTNLNEVHHTVLTEILLFKAAFYSPFWKLTKDNYVPKNINLYSQQTAHVLLRAKRKSKATAGYSELTFSKSKNSDSTDNAYLDFAVKSKYVNIFNNPDLQDKIQEKPETIVMLKWQASVIEANNKRIVCGQNQLRITKDEEGAKEVDQSGFCEDNRLFNVPVFRSKESIESDKAQTQVNYNVLHRPVIHHDFKINALCTVPIQLQIHSLVETEDLTVKVNTLDCNSAALDNTQKPGLFCPYSSKHFRWVGSEGVVKVLKAFGTEILDLSVAVLMPGTYDLGARLEICVLNVGQAEVRQKCRIESALIVIDGNS